MKNNTVFHTTQTILVYFIDGTKNPLKAPLKFKNSMRIYRTFTFTWKKTKVVWFVSNKGSYVVLFPEYKLDWNTEFFIVLVIKFTTDLKQIADLNFDVKIEEIKKYLCLV